jgi:hypothetical protein
MTSLIGDNSVLQVPISVEVDLLVPESGGTKVVVMISTSDGPALYEPEFELDDLVDLFLDYYEAVSGPMVLHRAANDFARLSNKLRCVANQVDGLIEEYEEDDFVEDDDESLPR